MHKRIFLLFFITAVASCSALEFYGYKNLGNHYFLWEGDHYTYSILWVDESRENPAAGGAEVIGEHIIKLNYDAHFIIAKRMRYGLNNHDTATFWLIDKTIPSNATGKNWKEGIVTGPLDSLELDKHLHQKRIDLNWTNAINLRPPH